MIEISRLDEFGLAAIAGCAELGEHVLICSEADLKDQIDKVKLFPLLVCVMPKSSGDDKGHDNFAEKNMGLFYVIAPIKEKMSKQDRVKVWIATQQAMQSFKYFIRSQMEQDSAFSNEFSNADFGNRDQEPEYNFLGCVGWSLLFPYNTSGM